MEATPEQNLRGLRELVASAPSLAIVRADEVRWYSQPNSAIVKTHVRWTCIEALKGPIPPSIVIQNSEEDARRVFHRLVVTAPEHYFVGLKGSDLIFAYEVELDDDGHYQLVNPLLGATRLEQLL